MTAAVLLDVFSTVKSGRSSWVAWCTVLHEHKVTRLEPLRKQQDKNGTRSDCRRYPVDRIQRSAIRTSVYCIYSAKSSSSSNFFGSIKLTWIWSILCLMPNGTGKSKWVKKQYDIRHVTFGYSYLVMSFFYIICRRNNTKFVWVYLGLYVVFQFTFHISDEIHFTSYRDILAIKDV